MADGNPTTWRSLDAFLTEDAQRRAAEAISYGGVFEPGPHSVPEEWELLWFPGTGELIEHRPEADPGVRLVGRTPHRDYIDAAIIEYDQSDKNAKVHRRRWQVTHPGKNAGSHDPWRLRSGSSGLRDRLAWWERLMEGRFLDGINEDEPLDDWGHTVDDVDGPLEWDPEAWDDLIPTAVAGVDEALRLERELRGRFNLAEVANLASKLHTTAQILHRVLLEAYGAAHRTHPGKVTRS